MTKTNMMDSYQKFIAMSRYARYMDDTERRETWEESVDRYISFMRKQVPEPIQTKAAFKKELAEAREAILNLEVMPSMRALMTAGPAAERNHVSVYNCAYTPIDNIRCFDEILYVLMNGTGVGFSVERQYITKLPEVSETFHDSDSIITVGDSKEGWASAYRELIALLYSGKVPKWDLSQVRAAGARLVTFGGRSSGPAPLEDLFRFTVRVFRLAAGRRLNSLEVHDLCCKIAAVVVVGGVRRSAEISLSNLTDQRMRHAKDGDVGLENPQRFLSNNSVAYTEVPDIEIFLEEWLALFRSKSGERGIFNRSAARRQVAKNGRREVDHEWGCNPCSEIILRPNQFCNLTEVVVRAGDTAEDLSRKVRIATFLGTLQCQLTNFKYLRKIWKTNCEEERLLGVSMTGILDHSELGDPDSPTLPTLLAALRQEAVEHNAKWARVLGIKQSSAITCVKPSGTVSQLVNSASGIHARYARWYRRRVRADSKDPLAKWMEEQGYPCEDDLFNPEVKVFSFPQKAPEGARVEGVLSAIDNLRLWKVYQDNWCEHKPSITIHYTPGDFLAVGAWVYEHFNDISGISFLPREGHIYQQAPYEAITEEEYLKAVADMPDPDWTLYREYYDNTTSSQELACSGGVCEVVDL